VTKTVSLEGVGRPLSGNHGIVDKEGNIMRILMAIAAIICMFAGGSRAEVDKEFAAIRMHSEQYMGALLQRDKRTLQALLHERYQGRSLPGISRLEQGNKAEALAHWTDLSRSFSRVTCRTESVRVFGDTAIEAGSMSANLKEYGSASTWSSLSYTRVWLREGQAWRLIHEQY
jgi:ketosteroid isomerase-like protein